MKYPIWFLHYILVFNVFFFAILEVDSPSTIHFHYIQYNLKQFSFCSTQYYCQGSVVCVMCSCPRKISATGCGYPKPAGWFSSSRVAASPSPPFAGDYARRSREMMLPFAGDDAAIRGSPRPAVRGRSRHRPAADSVPAGPPLTQCPPASLWLKPAGSPLTQSRRIAAESNPPDRRWLMPACRR